MKSWVPVLDGTPGKEGELSGPLPNPSPPREPHLIPQPRPDPEGSLPYYQSEGTLTRRLLGRGVQFDRSGNGGPSIRGPGVVGMVPQVPGIFFWDVVNLCQTKRNVGTPRSPSETQSAARHPLSQYTYRLGSVLWSDLNGRKLLSVVTVYKDL